MLDITPLSDKVVIEEEVVQEKVYGDGLLIVPVDKDAKVDRGVVVAVGPGKWEDGKLTRVPVKVGDKVLFGRYGYEKITLDDNKEYIIMSPHEILAVFNK